jgi:hypothetical protein
LLRLVLLPAESVLDSLGLLLEAHLDGARILFGLVQDPVSYEKLDPQSPALEGVGEAVERARGLIGDRDTR